MIDFFDFGSKLLSSTFQAGPVGLKEDENGVYDHLNLIKGKLKGIDFPVIFKQDYGKNLTDILDTGHAGLFLISDRMKKILEDSGLTGWQTFPIKLYDKKGSEILGYHGFSVIGHCGPISYEKSQIIEKRKVPTGPLCKFYKGEYIDLNIWDGTDFFTPDGTYETFITKKAADILTKNKITNMRLENLADKEIDIRIVENGNQRL
jgi:hypothetical protein